MTASQTSEPLVRAILLADASVREALGVDPATKIVVGEVPLNTPLPTIGLVEISSNDHRPLRTSNKVRVMARVQATVCGDTDQSRDALMLLVRHALRGYVGDPALPSGAICRGVTTQLTGKGPKFNIPGAEIKAQSQDVMVTYDENA